MARDLEYTRAELASAKQNLDKAHSDQSKVCFAKQIAIAWSSVIGANKFQGMYIRYCNDCGLHCTGLTWLLVGNGLWFVLMHYICSFC